MSPKRCRSHRGSTLFTLAPRSQLLGGIFLWGNQYCHELPFLILSTDKQPSMVFEASFVHSDHLCSLESGLWHIFEWSGWSSSVEMMMRPYVIFWVFLDINYREQWTFFNLLPMFVCLYVFSILATSFYLKLSNFNKSLSSNDMGKVYVFANMKFKKKYFSSHSYLGWISERDSAKYLGVVLDTRLRWTIHNQIFKMGNLQ